MNLLVTNTRNARAYAIIRALRPYADKIVVTMYGRNRPSARLSHAANSRLSFLITNTQNGRGMLPPTCSESR